jgi:hypothetical protein
MNVIHIGLPRTGNTTLQNSIYARQQRLFYIGKRDDAYPDANVRDLVHRICLQDSLVYDAQRTKALLQSICAAAASRPILLAHEMFSTEGRVDRRLIAERLNELLAPAKVLIIIRAQPTLLQAQYFKQLSAMDAKLQSFDVWLNENYGDTPFVEPNRVGLDYDRLVGTYQEIFGPENVVVLPSELMHDAGSLYATGLAALLQIPLATVQEALAGNVTDQRVSQRHILVHRLQHALPGKPNLAMLGRRSLPELIYNAARRFVTGGQRIEAAEVPAHWQRKIASLCAAGNTRLEKRKNLPLGALGYPVQA